MNFFSFPLLTSFQDDKWLSYHSLKVRFSKHRYESIDLMDLVNSNFPFEAQIVPLAVGASSHWFLSIFDITLLVFDSFLDIWFSRLILFISYFRPGISNFPQEILAF